jgi:mitogen-activated protein kinase 1/3
MATDWQTVHISQNVTMRVPIEYKFVKKLGAGSFGTVAAFENSKTGKKVAVKKISQAFQDLMDAKRNLREIKLLRSMKHDCIVSIVDMFLPESRNFEDIYIVQEMMDTDLHKVIQSKQKLTEDHCQYFVYQILTAVHYLHRSNVVHRDLKPANVLVNTNCDIKVCDFGLGLPAWDEQEDLSEYVVSRWWRAPEIVLLPSKYTSAVDIWSVGCTLAELLGRKPIFPGKDHVDQLRVIFQVTGTPSENDIEFLPPPPCAARTFLAKLPKRPVQPWSTLYPDSSESIRGLGCHASYQPNAQD